MAKSFFELDSDTLRAQLKEIENLDLRVCTVEQIAYKIRRLIPAIGGFQVRIPTYDSAMCVYRAVKLGDGEDRPVLTTRISYPPGHIVTGFGRLNRPGEVLFYCSTHKDAPYFELGFKAGDRGVLSTWQTTDTLFANHLGFSPANFKSVACERDLPRWHAPEVENELHGILREWLARQFACEVQDDCKFRYKLTVAIADVADARNIHGSNTKRTKFDSFIYPSIGSWMRGDNLALKPFYVDSFLRLRQVEYFFVKSVGDRVIETQPLDYGSQFRRDGTIVWLSSPSVCYATNYGFLSP